MLAQANIVFEKNFLGFEENKLFHSALLRDIIKNLRDWYHFRALDACLNLLRSPIPERGLAVKRVVFLVSVLFVRSGSGPRLRTWLAFVFAVSVVVD